ncbi:hypothetical protein, partial [Microbulbifer hainanensis]|uniref:hypothetical protein n=1 Tax=Microbulbifer hainanensis TaxID=2735675 RepID=UPI001D00C0CF
GKITTPRASDTFTDGVTISATTFLIDASSFVDVSGKGTLPLVGDYPRSGGSYGGMGGRASDTGETNVPYGDYK